jgi:DNA-binding transcriptional ArsR family regulator
MTDPHAAFFKSLSSPSRTAILRLLSQNGEMSVDELTAAVELAGPTVSRHLQALRQQELVAVRRDAQNRYYSVDTKKLEQRFQDFLAYLVAAP